MSVNGHEMSFTIRNIRVVLCFSATPIGDIRVIHDLLVSYNFLRNPRAGFYALAD